MENSRASVLCGKLPCVSTQHSALKSLGLCPCVCVCVVFLPACFLKHLNLKANYGRIHSNMKVYSLQITGNEQMSVDTCNTEHIAQRKTTKVPFGSEPQEAAASIKRDIHYSGLLKLENVTFNHRATSGQSVIFFKHKNIVPNCIITQIQF